MISILMLSGLLISGLSFDQELGSTRDRFYKRDQNPIMHKGLIKISIRSR